jgi:hypothetical protein
MANQTNSDLHESHCERSSTISNNPKSGSKNMHILRLYKIKLVLWIILAAIPYGILQNINFTAYAQQVVNDCVPYGRIIQSQVLSLRGKLICQGKGQDLQKFKSVMIRFTCYLSQEVVQSTVEKIPQVCQSQREEQKIGCYYAGVIRCPQLKGGESIALIEPYSDLVLSGDPKFTWTEVFGADQYLVTLESESASWNATTNRTSLLYPNNQPLKPGERYQVIITALRGSNVIAVTHSSINRLSESEIRSLQEDLQLIKGLNLPDTDLLQDIDSVYMSRGLLTESIQHLQRFISAKPTSSATGILLLSLRFAIAGQINEAEAQYELAYQIAQNANDPALIHQVENSFESLQKIKASYNQSPSNEKPAQ